MISIQIIIFINQICLKNSMFQDRMMNALPIQPIAHFTHIGRSEFSQIGFEYHHICWVDILSETINMNITIVSRTVRHR